MRVRRAGGHRYPGYQYRMHPLVKQELEAVAGERDKTLADLLDDIVREFLVGQGRWPDLSAYQEKPAPPRERPPRVAQDGEGPATPKAGKRPPRDTSGAGKGKREGRS
jgi:hypothetical protein